jgi:hypothetical protein
VRNQNITDIGIQNIKARCGTAPLTINHINQDLTPNTGKLVHNQSNYIKRLYKEILEANPDNALIINDYIIAEEAEINIQESTTETGTKVTKSSFRSASRCS